MRAEPAHVTSPPPWRRRVDPEGRAWRNALRGVVCAAPLFAVYAALDLVQWAPWAFIGLLNTLLPDVGGPTRPRLRTGLEILVGSVAAVFLGALVGDVPVLLVATMFVVAFGAAYLGVCSPYLAAAGVSVLLVFLLSAGTPSDVGDAAWRMLHCGIGAALATAAMLALVPAPRRRRIEPALSDACHAIAALLDPPGAAGPGAELDQSASHPGATAGVPGAPDGLEASARAATARVVGVTTTQRWPPLSTSRVDRARLAFIHDLQSLFTRAVAIHRNDNDPDHAAASVGTAERAAAAEGLRELARWLVDEGPAPDGRSVAAASGHAAALELELRQEASDRVGQPEALDRFRAGRRVAAACRLVAVLTDGAAAAAFHTEEPVVSSGDQPTDVTGELLTYRRRLRSNLTPRSMVFRHAVRLGVACAIAAAVEQALGLERGYWTVLTVVVSLRTNRGASAHRSFERILGTVGGLVVAAGSIAFARASESPTAVIMVVTVVLLALTLWCSAAQLRWALAVTAITSCVLTMFQLVSPGDWTLEKARFLATALGVAISLAVAFVLWPGGALRALRHAISRAAAAQADRLEAAVGSAPDGPDRRALERARAAADDEVVVCRSTLGAANRDDLIGQDSPLTIAVLEVEQAAELVRRVDRALAGVDRSTTAPESRRLVQSAAEPAAALLRRAGAGFVLTPLDGVRSAPAATALSPDEAATATWAGLDESAVLALADLDAVADLVTLGHRGDDLAVLAAAATPPPEASRESVARVTDARDG
jgi:uncharacterized membrane protein YccC